MSEETKRLDRDSDLYNNTVLNKVINESTFESEVVEITNIRYNIDLHGKLSWRSLTEKHCIDNITYKEYSKYKSMSSYKLAREFRKDPISLNRWSVDSTKVMVYLTFNITLELPDGEELELKMYENILNKEGYQVIVDLFNSLEYGNKVNITFNSDEEYTIETENGKIISSDVEVSKYNKFKNQEFIKEYFVTENKWVEASVSEVLENNERIIVTIGFGSGEELRFEFNSPESNPQFWEIVDILGEGDPLMMSDSDVYICLSMIQHDNNYNNDNILFENESWMVRKNKPTYIEKIISRIKSILP